MAIVSRSRGFIFIKTHKTAGTSMEVELSRQCSADDIVTPILPASPLHRPRNYVTSSGSFYNHMSAAKIRDFIGAEIYQNSFKFCVERHPVDKCLSYFGMLLNSPLHRTDDPPRSWDEYVERGIFPVDDPLYTDSSGQLIVDTIYRFDDLPFVWTSLCCRLGMTAGPLRAKEKTGLRGGTLTLSQALSNRAHVNRILDAFASTTRHISWN